MKIGFVSLGCPKNLVDAEVMIGTAERAGHTVTSNAADADVLVVNTCAFIEGARQESIDAVLEMAELKKRAPGRRLIVTGCLAERYREALRREIPEIDAMLGTGDVESLPSLLGSSAPRDQALPGAPSLPAMPVRFYRQAAASRQDAPRAPRSSPALPTYLYDATTPRRRVTPRHYAYVKIAEGCDYRCAFCIIPTLRGHYRSRTVDSVVAEARALAEDGVKELLLVSQDTTFFGIDRGERGALPRLLRALNGVDGLEWIRLLYLYPTTITPETIDAVAGLDKVVNYIDLPLQHAADRVLARMGRPGTRASYRRLLLDLRSRLPDVVLRTAFITGFPGETDADVDALVDFIDEIGFDHVGVFTYSHEEGTPAWGLADDVPDAVKAERRDRVMARQRDLVAARQAARIGERARVLVDGPSAEHDLVLQARLPGQAPDIDPVVYLTECDPAAIPPGSLVEVDIVGAEGYDLVARPLPAPASGSSARPLRVTL